jgi:hypothetical protein
MTTRISHDGYVDDDRLTNIALTAQTEAIAGSEFAFVQPQHVRGEQRAGGTDKGGERPVVSGRRIGERGIRLINAGTAEAGCAAGQVRNAEAVKRIPSSSVSFLFTFQESCTYSSKAASR